MKEFAEMNSKNLDTGKTVFIPVGAVENHGPSLPIGTDSLIAEAFARKFADGVSGIVMPALFYGVCPGTDGLAGTVSVSHSAFVNYLSEICVSMLNGGFRNIMIVGIHGGNDAALKTVVEKIFLEKRAPLYYLNPYTFMKDDPEGDVFAGRSNNLKEASLLAAAMMILGMGCGDPGGSVSEGTMPPRPEELTALRKYGTVGFAYNSESEHISPCKDNDIEAGLLYFKRAADRVRELTGHLRKHVERSGGFYGDKCI